MASNSPVDHHAASLRASVPFRVLHRFRIFAVPERHTREVIVDHALHLRELAAPGQAKKECRVRTCAAQSSKVRGASRRTHSFFVHAVARSKSGTRWPCDEKERKVMVSLCTDIHVVPMRRTHRGTRLCRQSGLLARRSPCPCPCADDEREPGERDG
eukprot:scaffold259223_cov43-Tisochrysis_lutea.AAC.1